MSKYVDITLKDKSWIFPGSVRTFSCPPTENCPKCGGRGTCVECAGKGEIRCDTCGGRGEIRCYDCHGTGRNSSGKACVFCDGTGWKKCYSCHGKGFKTCYACGGSGNCNYCGGSGQVTCRRCKGTGYYQTYLEYTAHYCVRQFCYPGATPELLDGLRLATGEEIYSTVCKCWKRVNKVAFDDTQKCLDAFVNSDGTKREHAEAFRRGYDKVPELHQAIPGFQPYKNTLRASNIPYTRVRYEVNDREYEMVLLGNNGVVMYDALPESIKAFEMTPAQKVKYDRFASRRHRDIAKLTAYIFNLDGISPEESRTLSLILRHMCMNARQREFYTRYLTYRFSAKLSHEAVIRKMKYLFMTRKTVSYAWQCMAVDRKLSGKELEFFNKIVSYYGLSDCELAELKRYSQKFASLEDGEFVKEYLDSEPVLQTEHYKKMALWAWGLFSVLLFALGIIISTKNEEVGSIFIFLNMISICGIAYVLYNRYQHAYRRKQHNVNKLFAEVSTEPDYDLAYIQGGNIIVRFVYGLSDVLLKTVAFFGLLFDKIGDYMSGIFRSKKQH